MKVQEALEYLTQAEEQKLVDMDSVRRGAVERVEQAGIIFVDEIDKISGREGAQGPDVSREGVQRDILPIVEGTTVNTKHGMVRTDHILFIAAGAFHVSKPSDLIPELQGRFPIRVELEALGKEEFVRIRTEPKGALITQYTALLATEGLNLEFTLMRSSGSRVRLAGQRSQREHRGKTLAHRDGEAPRRDFVRRARDGGARGRHRWWLRRPHARRHREGRRSVPIHSVTCPRLASPLSACLALAAIALGCGMKGPPLAPLVIVPAQVANVSAERFDDQVFVSFQVPSENTDGSAPADLDRVEVYALTTHPVDGRDAQPAFDDWFDAASLVATILVRPPGATEPNGETAEGSSGDDASEVQGAEVTVVEHLTPDAFVPQTLEDEDEGAAEAEADPRGRATACVPAGGAGAATPPRRTYVSPACPART